MVFAKVIRFRGIGLDLTISVRPSFGMHVLTNLNPNGSESWNADSSAHFKTIGHDLTTKWWKVGLNPAYQSQAK